MGKFLTEHGGIIVIGVVSIVVVSLMLIIIITISNMDALVLTSIIGE